MCSNPIIKHKGMGEGAVAWAGAKTSLALRWPHLEKFQTLTLSSSPSSATFPFQTCRISGPCLGAPFPNYKMVKLFSGGKNQASFNPLPTARLQWWGNRALFERSKVTHFPAKEEKWVDDQLLDIALQVQQLQAKIIFCLGNFKDEKSFVRAKPP